ncbi:rhomboid family intramembrane serine protease [Bacteroidia bacterium]|nr:rhomboid family intramembrane serine protease [Bacteroidia bacterium]
MRIGNTELQPLTKFLLFANIAVFILVQMNSDLFIYLAAFFPGLDYFIPTQIITHMFMHGGVGHIFFNMFGLFIFGNFLERVLGSKKFGILYFVSGFGAYALHLASQYYDFYELNQYLAASSEPMTAAYFLKFVDYGVVDALLKSKGWTSILSPVVGASGCLYGLLAAFAYLFPNTELMLLFIPFPIKAKYFVPIMVGIDLFLGFNPVAMDNIAHFAHIGGALFGFLLVIFWNKYNKREFY